MINDSYLRLQEKLIFSTWDEKMSNTSNHCSLLINTHDYSVIESSIEKLIKDKQIKPESIHVHTLEKMTEKPCDPFLSMARNALTDKSEDEITAILDNCKLYSFQKEIFYSFFCGHETARIDELNREEIGYEQNKLHNTLKLLFENLYPGRQLVVIYNAHFTGESTHKLIRYLNEHGSNSNILILLVTRKDSVPLHEKQRLCWDQFTDYLEKNYMIMLSDLDQTSKYSNDEIDQAVDTPVSVETRLLPISNDKIDTILEMICMFYDWMALHEANMYAVEVLDWITVTNTAVDKSYLYKLHYIAGCSALLLDRIDASFSNFNSLLNLAQSGSNSTWLIEAYRKIAMVSFIKYNIDDCLSFINKSITLAEKEKDPVLLMKASVTRHRIDRAINYDDVTWKTRFLEAVQYTSEIEADNSLSDICQVSRMGMFDFEETWYYIQKSILIAKKHGNLFRLSGAYHCMGILYAHVKQHKRALKFYKKSERIRKRVGTEFSLMQIYNGLGYYLFTLEQYRSAQKNYFKVLHYLYNMKNISELLLTFYNIGMCALFSMNHKNALIWFENMMHIMRKLNIHTFPFHEREEIVSLLGICYFKTGRYAKAYEMYSLRRPESMHPDHEAYIPFILLNALIAKKESRYSVADACFKELFIVIHKHYKNFYMYIPRVYFEYLLFLKKSGNMEEYNTILVDGISACESIRFNFHKQLIIRESEGEIFQFPTLPETTGKFDISILNDYLEHQSTISSLNRKMSEIHLLNTLQSILMNNNDVSTLIRESMILLNNSFAAEMSCCLLQDKNKMVMEYSVIPESFGEIDLVSLAETTEQSGGEVFEQSITLNEIQFSSFVMLPLRHEKNKYGIIMCGTFKEGVFLTHDDFRILTIASQQMSIALHNIHLYHELELKNSFKSIYLTNLSHEIKTPLNAIMGYNQNLMYGSFLVDSELHKINNAIAEIAEKEKSTTKDDVTTRLLDFTNEFETLIFSRNHD
jgi:tetratricopeptide (TPR) repeat protein